MNEHTVTVTIKGVAHYFNGNELISAMQEAIFFLHEQDYIEREF
tara:strand:+ start:310 stop:441 length:132 start_codon:yes stop_codon:yes gene_type:complete